MGGFGARHSLSAATWNNKTILFGGQDVFKEKCFNEMFVYDHKTNEIEQHEYLKEGLVIPEPRNSHGFIQKESKAYIFGGANEEGPRNDAYELNLENLEFRRIKLADPF